MHFRITISLAGLALLVLAGCGGGGGGTEGVADLNPYEKQLVGTYELTNFEMYEYGVKTYFPADFPIWDGAIVLNEDRTATVGLRFCEHEGDTSRTCDRVFTWSADAGMLRLHAVEAGEEDSVAAWTMEGYSVLHLEMLQPTNEPDCDLLIMPDGGREELSWERH